MTEAVDGWMKEASEYDNPRLSLATENFTQVVWKGTTSIAAARKVFPPGKFYPDRSGVLIVAYWSPPGNTNTRDQLTRNVGRHFGSE